MVKTKAGRILNPADAFRKEQRKKENVRNKKERDWLRAANQKISKPEELRGELKELIEKEQAGFNLSRDEKLKKRILQDAFDAAVKRKTEEEMRKKAADSTAPEESPFYHPTLNPTGAAPAARPVGPTAKPGLPVPKPPPLPAGPKPTGLPPPPAAPPLPAGPGPSSADAAAAAAAPPPLPPPSVPPPGVVPLPPPAGPPPGWLEQTADEEGPPGVAPLPPPPGLPPSIAASRLPPPMGPPPGMMMMMMMPPPGGLLPPLAGGPIMLPPMAASHSYSAAPALVPPAGPPPAAGAAAAAAAAARKEVKSTITGASTAVRLQPAALNKAVTSMVPASVRVRRDDLASKAKAAKSASAAGITASSGFGLAPVSRPAAPAGAAMATGTSTALGAAAPGKAAEESSRPFSVDDKYKDFMKQMAELGAL